MKKLILLLISLLFFAGLFQGLGPHKAPEVHAVPIGNDFTFEVRPETFQITIESNGVQANASEALPPKKVSNYRKTVNKIAWSYPEEDIDVDIQKQPDYLHVTIRAGKPGEFQWPVVSAVSYVLPLWEGKYIPSRDPHWKAFLVDQEMVVSASLSMNFFALLNQKYAVVYIIENMFDNTLTFDTKDKIKMAFHHRFPSIQRYKEYSFRIYTTTKDPVEIADLYKRYISKFTTLHEKAKTNPNIEKLYGAPHIYLWDKEFIWSDNIHWQRFKKQAADRTFAWITTLLKEYIEEGAGAAKELDRIKKQDYISNYQKDLFVSSLNKVLRLKEFYNPAVFADLDTLSKNLINKGIPHLNQVELYELNKLLLKSWLKEASDPVANWGNGNSLDLLHDMHNSGIENAWLGFTDWIPGFINPEFVRQANALGYLVAPYDSYHSIHEKGDPDWITASFADETLYEKATITGANGKKVAGFLGRGRKLNPTLSLPSVRQRVESILSTGVPFNSWFIDCDAFGEFYNDYSPEHLTTQAEDMQARLERMAYIRDNKAMVIGSEQGNDYASQTIAFAHGLETPVIKWSDPDIRQNKNSPYYEGAYWSPKGGVPPKFFKQVPIKELYKHIYLSPVYSLPLFKLVYNNAVITTHHWEWGSLKIKDEVRNRMLYEVLYNVPPLYHLDKEMWKSFKDIILPHLKVWAPFHKQAVTKEMTGFKVLSADRMLQLTEYGDNLKVIANFSDRNIKYQDIVIKGKTLVVYNVDNRTEYTP